MLFTFLAAVAACQSTAMRPELSRTRVSQKIATVGDLLSTISSPKESVTALQEAVGIVDGILAETGNATEHMSDDDAALLRSVIDLVETSIYGSMDSAHAADEQALADGVYAVEQCNADIHARQAPDGDLGKLHQSVSDDQTELNRLQGVVDDETSKNASAWDTFNNYMQMISNPPACPGLPGRTMPQLDVFFEKSEYSIWFAHNEAAYAAARALYVSADAALAAAIEAYNIQKAIRDTQYCDWKVELEAACASFDSCFAEKSDAFNKELVPRVQRDMNSRIEAFKAGQTLIHQIKFLLADATNQETPDIDTSRYELDFPVLPPKGDCDLSVLDDASWVPQPTCSHQLLDGCSSGGNLYAPFGSPRMEADDSVAGEAVCCNAEGKGTRNIRDGQGLFNQGLSHVDCTTTSGIQLRSDSPPSHNYHEAKAICEAVGLRLCRSQEEVDTSCGTGCHINFALVWVD